MNIIDRLKAAGYTPELSKSGEMPIFEGTYKATLIEISSIPDNGYGESILAKFQATECLEGDEYGLGKKFSDFYSTSDENISNNRKGLAKLLNGLFSVGIEVDGTVESLERQLGSAEVFINAYKKQKMQKDESSATGWSKIEGEFKQAFTFMTEKNALKESKKQLPF